MLTFLSKLKSIPLLFLIIFDPLEELISLCPCERIELSLPLNLDMIPVPRLRLLSALYLTYLPVKCWQHYFRNYSAPWCYKTLFFLVSSNSDYKFFIRLRLNFSVDLICFSNFNIFSSRSYSFLKLIRSIFASISSNLRVPSPFITSSSESSSIGVTIFFFLTCVYCKSFASPNSSRPSRSYIRPDLRYFFWTSSLIYLILL